MSHRKVDVAWRYRDARDRASDALDLAIARQDVLVAAWRAAESDEAREDLVQQIADSQAKVESAAAWLRTLTEF